MLVVRSRALTIIIHASHFQREESLNTAYVNEVNALTSQALAIIIHVSHFQREESLNTAYVNEVNAFPQGDLSRETT